MFYELLKPTTINQIEPSVKAETTRMGGQNSQSNFAPWQCPNGAKPVKTYLENIKQDVLPHAPCSPDLAPSDYYLFRSMQHGLLEQHVNSYEQIKNWIGERLASRDERWCWERIHQLPKRWKKPIDNDRQCFALKERIQMKTYCYKCLMTLYILQRDDNGYAAYSVTSLILLFLSYLTHRRKIRGSNIREVSVYKECSFIPAAFRHGSSLRQHRQLR